MVTGREDQVGFMLTMADRSYMMTGMEEVGLMMTDMEDWVWLMVAEMEDVMGLMVEKEVENRRASSMRQHRHTCETI